MNTIARNHFPIAAQLAQWLEHQTFNLRVVGSNPVLGAIIFATP